MKFKNTAVNRGNY